MKRFYYLAGVVLTVMAIYSCSEDTAGIGQSLTSATDQLDITTEDIEVDSTRTIIADSVFTLGNSSYLGRVRDPETLADVKSEFTTQFHVLDDMFISPGSKFVSRGEDGLAAADSCDIILYVSSPYNAKDSLSSVKMKIYELQNTLEEGTRYYSSFDPIANDFVRTNGLNKGKMLTFLNQLDTDEERDESSYLNNIRITLNAPYTAPDGTTYNNYGTYLIRMYHQHPEYFRNSYSFSHNVCPGFFFQVADGYGFYSKLSNIGLRTFYRLQDEDSVANYSFTLASTKEVLQTTYVTNDKKALEKLAAEKEHTYLKTPAGIFTEIELPVEKIMEGHFNDSLLSVSMTVQRQNSLIPMNLYLIPAPNTILMIQKDSLNSFFEKESTYDYRDSFVANLSKNSYSFRNMGNMVTLMYTHMLVGSLLDPEWIKKHPNWNKVVLVPVTTISTATATTTSSKNTTATVSYICNNFGLTSTQLTGGNTPIKISVIYARFNEKKQ